MKGQWIGRTTDGQAGRVLLNIDDVGEHYSGMAFFMPDDIKYLSSACEFKTIDKSNDFKFKAIIYPIDPRNGAISTWDLLKPILPSTPHSTTVDVSGRFENHSMNIKAMTDLGVKFEFDIIRKPFTNISSIKGELKSWEEFKEYVASFSNKEYIYRGQERNYFLRTSFHRRGRYNITRFINEDIPKLYQRLTARTRHVFNLSIPMENGAFYNLAQHHGYPTPLLDWTFSPYVGAFFAFRKIKKGSKDNGNVRIFIFDQLNWKKDTRQSSIIDIAEPHLSFWEFLAIDNDRAIPQQAVTTITNIDDIETYVSFWEEQNKVKYLWAVDIPSTERDKAITELSYMGITAGSMFPGLDGTCEELRERMFDK
jgi:hypothetical protein